MKKIFLGFLLITSLSYDLFPQSNSTSAKDSSLIYSNAVMMSTSGNYAEAIKLLKSIENISENAEHIHYQLAECYLNQNNIELFIHHSEKSIQINRTFIKPYLLLFNYYQSKERFDDAVAVIHHLLESNPDLSDYYFTLGYIYISNISNYNLSEYCFTKFLGNSEKNPIPAKYLEMSNLFLADIYYNQQKFDLAVEHINNSVKINSENNIKVFQFANFLISNNYLNESVKSLQYYLDNLPKDQKNNPFNKRVYAYLGNMYFLKDDPRAYEYVQIGSQDNANEGKICKALIKVLKNQNEEALSDLLQINKEAPGYSAVMKGLATVYERKGDMESAYNYYIGAGLILSSTNLFDETKKMLLSASKIKPDIPRLNFMLAELFEKNNQYSMAIYYYDKYDPEKKDNDMLLHIAYLYHIQKNYKLRDYVLNQVYQRNYNNPNYYFTLGIIQNSENRFKDAALNLKKAIGLKKDNHLYYFYLAIAQEKNGDKNGTIDSLKKALKYDNNNASYLNYLGYMYADMNINLDEAATLINEALYQNPFNGAYLDSLGWTYYRMGKYKEAEKYLLKAKFNLLAEKTDDPIVYDHLGDTYIKLGNKEMAVFYWQKSIALKNSPIIKKKIDSETIKGITK